MPRIVALTGGIASGKSTVSATWKSHGITVIDADEIAREVVKPGTPALWLIRRRFGEDVMNDDGTLNRAALGRIIFADRKQRGALNRRIHPFIILEILNRVLAAIFIRWRSIVIIDAPVLYESGTLVPFCSCIVVVTCEPEQQMERMLARDSNKQLTREEAENRIASQIPLEEKARRADIVIDNSGDKDQLEQSCLTALDELQPSYSGELAFRGLVIVVAAKIAVRLIHRFGK